jgi:hypothetical protein
MTKGGTSQTKSGTLSLATGALIVAFGATGAGAQTAAGPAPSAPAGAAPPVARQIEPMVAPVRRVAPKQVAAPLPVIALPAVAGGIAAWPALAPKPMQAAASPPKAVSGAGKGVVGRTAQAVLQPAAKAAKIVVHTCRLGQDYSEKLKSCFTPGVTKVTSAVKAVRSKVTASFDTATRSSLGAKRKN